MKPCPQPPTPRRSFGGRTIGRIHGLRWSEAGIAAQVVPPQSSRWTVREGQRPTCRPAEIGGQCHRGVGLILGENVSRILFAHDKLMRDCASTTGGAHDMHRRNRHRYLTVVSDLLAKKRQIATSEKYVPVLAGFRCGIAAEQRPYQSYPACSNLHKRSLVRRGIDVIASLPN
jgi:hypothetical protein